MSFIKIKDPRKREELIKDLIETRKRIKDNFIARKVGEAEYKTGLTKLFKPVTETQKATAKEITDAQKATVEKITSELLPIREGLENLTVIPPIEAGEPLPAITEEQITKIGKIATDHLLPVFGKQNTQSDIKPGHEVGSLFKIGNTPIEIENDDITIYSNKFKGTPGLWKLLTSREIPNKTEYNKQDLQDYIIIMSGTNTIRKDYNRNNIKPIPGNKKMNKLIKPFVLSLEKEGVEKFKEKLVNHFKDPQPSTSDTGLKILPSDPNALIDRFDLLFSSKKAGHTGVRNEIISILDELKRQRVINVNDYKKLNRLIKK